MSVSSLPPQNLDAEELVLGGVMLAASHGVEKSRAAVGKAVKAGLVPESFYRETHGRMFSAMVALTEAKKPADVLSVVDELKRTGGLESAGGQGRVQELAVLASTSSNVEHHAGIVVRAGRERQLHREMQGMAQDLAEGRLGTSELVRRMESIQSMARARMFFGVKSYDEILADYESERGAPDTAGEPTRLGFGSLDADIRGVSPGQVLAWAARTSVGKTWALNAIEEYACNRRDSGILVVTLEQPGGEWFERALAVHDDVAPERVEEWAKSGELRSRAAAFLEKRRNVVVVDEPTHLDKLPLVVSNARDRLEVPLRLVLIDYAGLLQTDGRTAYERSSALAKGLKLFAKTERVAVVVAMQLSRAGADGSQPVTIEMLRDSGVLEESVDFLVGAWRPGKAQGLSPPEAMNLQDVMRCAILKNRKGREGRVVDLRFRTTSRRLYEEDSYAEAF